MDDNGLYGSYYGLRTIILHTFRVLVVDIISTTAPNISGYQNGTLFLETTRLESPGQPEAAASQSACNLLLQTRFRV